MKKDWEQSVNALDVNSVGQQLELGAPVNSRNRHGQTALMIAATRGDVALSRLLIDYGADLNVTAKYGLSALMLAVLYDHEEVVWLLCEAGANRTIRGTGAPGFAGCTALDLAERAGRSRLSLVLTT
jgi:ankyrin repeat protein